MCSSAKIYGAGHHGLAGFASMRTPHERGYANFVTRTHGELDLTNQAVVRNLLCRREREAQVICNGFEITNCDFMDEKIGV